LVAYWFHRIFLRICRKQHVLFQLNWRLLHQVTKLSKTFISTSLSQKIVLHIYLTHQIVLLDTQKILRLIDGQTVGLCFHCSTTKYRVLKILKKIFFDKCVDWTKVILVKFIRVSISLQKKCSGSFFKWVSGLSKKQM
jgi:hypothetical protein